MLTKSLVIFIGVGVVSGLVFGAFLYDLKNSSQPAFVEGPSLFVLTDKSAYKQGETIQIRIINSGTAPLKFSDATFGFKITGLSGFVIYGHGNGGGGGGDDGSDNRNNTVNGDTEQILKPGQQVIFSWNMLKTDGTPVLAGVYKIHTAATAVDTNAYSNDNATATGPDPISASTTITVT